jgi:hypothetical protein
MLNAVQARPDENADRRYDTLDLRHDPARSRQGKCTGW